MSVSRATPDPVETLNAEAPTIDSAPGSRILSLFAKGFCIGSANVVPGVSGGTMAFILGIYEELIATIRAFGQPEFLYNLFKLRLRAALKATNPAFLLPLALGVFSAVVTLSRWVEWLLDNHPVHLWSFFFGLVAASAVVVSWRVRSWNRLCYTAMVLSTAFAWFLVGLVPLETPETWWFIVLSGAMASVAMILPGISGAFILVLLGKYQFVLNAVNERDLVGISLVGAGAVIGIVAFAQVLGWVLKKWHDPVIVVLTGLMVGSLRQVWPWKIDTAWITGRNGQMVPILQENTFPDVLSDPAARSVAIVALLLAVLGLVTVILIEKAGAGEGITK